MKKLLALGILMLFYEMSFATVDCTNFSLIEATENSLLISLPTSPNCDNPTFEVQLRIYKSGDLFKESDNYVVTENASGFMALIEDLEPCTEYDLLVYVYCDGKLEGGCVTELPYSTLGCDPCCVTPDDFTVTQIPGTCDLEVCINGYEECDIIYYIVRYQEVGKSGYSQVISEDNCVPIMDLEEGKEYNIWVLVRTRDCGITDASYTQTITLVDCHPCCATPEDFTITQIPGTCDLEVCIDGYEGCDIVYYIVRYQKVGDPGYDQDLNVLNCLSIEGFEAGEEYNIWVLVRTRDCGITEASYTQTITIQGINGKVFNHCNDSPVVNVDILSSPDNNSCSTHQTSTDEDGAYAHCTCAETGTTYHIVPSKDGDDLCGLNALDLLLLQNHVAQIQELDTPYKIIAADLFCDDLVDIRDVLVLRRLILGIDLENPHCDSWDFVDAAYVFPNPASPFNPPYPDYVDVLLPDSEANFVGIKKGDLDCSGVDCGDGFVGEPSGEVELVFNETSVKKGEVFVLPVKANGFEEISAYQMGLHFNPEFLSFVEMLPGNVPYFSEDNFGLSNVEQGDWRSIWLSEDGEPGKISDGAILFEIKLVASQDIHDLRSVITSGEEVLRSEAYTLSGSTYEIKLSFEEGEGSGKERSGQMDAIDFDLMVHPNPIAGDEIYFTFNLPQASNTSLRIYDLLGRVVYQQTVKHPAGFQQVLVDGLEQWTNGIYTYRFETDQQMQTGKIVKTN